MKRRHIVAWLGAASGGLLSVAAVVGAVASGCQSTPTPIPLRTFDRPQKVAAVCLGVNNADGTPVGIPAPNPLGACPPVPFNVDGHPFMNHMYALVTQQTRGELAVVDLTAGYIIDEDRSTPGINFIPVGANPSDVVVSPDFDPTTTFVSSRDPNSFAVYAIDNTRLLGDALTQAAPLTLRDLRVCSLPQPPLSLGILTFPPSTSGADAGGAPGLPAYAVTAVLQQWAGSPAQVVTIDPRPLLSEMTAGIQQLDPGSVAPCRLLGATTLAGASAVPQGWSTGASWPDGVPYADAGAASSTPSLGPACSMGPGDGGPQPAFSQSFDAGPFIPGQTTPEPSSIAVRDDVPVAYVADGALPLVHVLDYSAAGVPVETGQLFATRVQSPNVPVSVGALALSPATSDHRRFLYAVDGNDGSLMVFDVTNPVPPSPPETPLLRPHPELTPLQPVDRITFAAPVAAVTFATHDWPLIPPSSPGDSVALTGLLCNPNPNAFDGGTTPVDGGLGAYYRADHITVIQPQSIDVNTFTTRLRGVFAFVALSNGNLETVDVDDWDAPCRRPDPMTEASLSDGGGLGVGFGQTGDLALPQPDLGDLDPYHAPFTEVPTNGTTGVSEEAFFPVSAPSINQLPFPPMVITLAAAPGAPVSPIAPFSPVSPLSPWAFLPVSTSSINQLPFAPMVITLPAVPVAPASPLVPSAFLPVSVPSINQ
ncbi:MAG: hypothetical protein FWD17_18855, partial [Polyangiaceae bacterium]|nr:hypothetical protein [Polyangiaceae bacterium]